MSVLASLLILLPLSSPDPFICPPYVQALSEYGAMVLWKQTGKAPAKVTLTNLADGSRVTRTVTGGKMRSVTWTDLTAYDRYEYSVSVGSKHYEGSFRTGRSPAAPFVFLVFGDTRYNVSEHRSVVEAMALERPDLIVHTGDVVHRAEEPLYERFFRVEHPIMASSPLYPALGNHELSRSWTRGRKLFEKYFRIPNLGPCLGVCYSLVHGNSMFIFLDSNVPILGAPQEAWAMDRLVEASTDPSIQHIFVVLHHGPFSSGPHGPNWELADSDLFDAFQRFGVDIVFSGHDHIYERGRVGRVTYVVTAGGGAPLYPIKHVLSTTQVVEAVFHYVRVRVSGPNVEVAAYRVDGSLLDWFRLGPASPSKASTSTAHQVATSAPSRPKHAALESAGAARGTHAKGGRGEKESRDGCRTTGQGRPAVWLLPLVLLAVRRVRTRNDRRHTPKRNGT